MDKRIGRSLTVKKWLRVLTAVMITMVALGAWTAFGPEGSVAPKAEPAKATATPVPYEPDRSTLLREWLAKATPTPKVNEKAFWVEYRVKSNVAGVKVEVTYETPGGDTVGGTVTTPWVKKYQFEEYDVVQLMAKNLGSGCITVQIWSPNTIAEEKKVCGLRETAIISGALY